MSASRLPTNAVLGVGLLQIASLANAADPPNAQSPVSTEIQYTTSPMGSAFYYDPATASTSADGKTGTVRARVVHSMETIRLFGFDVASSVGTLVFNCVDRTYVYESVIEFDDSGRPIEVEFPRIALAPVVQYVTKDSEPVYEAACSKRSNAQN